MLSGQEGLFIDILSILSEWPITTDSDIQELTAWILVNHYIYLSVLASAMSLSVKQSIHLMNIHEGNIILVSYIKTAWQCSMSHQSKKVSQLQSRHGTGQFPSATYT